MAARPTVSLLTLGCARNDVNSEELAARLAADGWSVRTGAAEGEADVVVVNTCGFVAQAKAESIETILDAGGAGAPVVAVGCLAERYGRELADELPEAAAVVGFDGYDDLGDRLRRVVAGEPVPSHEPRDRRTMLPISPVLRPGGHTPPGHGAAPGLDLPGTVLRRRLAGGPVASLKIASGCDRRCAFCAIPRFRGAFVSRPAADVVAEARWLAGQGVREVVLVSENSTSYGKDLGDPRLLERLLPELAAVDGIERIRVSYLQPAEVRPGLIDAIAGTDTVADYFDLSFQHASGPLLRRMRRFGSADTFIELVNRIRGAAPAAGIRSNVIVGFPGETDEDFAVLEHFVAAAELDAIGVFGYSAEDDTEAAGMPDQVNPDVIAERVARMTALADHVASARAADRVGQPGTVLVERAADGGAAGRLACQGPEDGETLVAGRWPAGALVNVVVTDSDGVDLAGTAREPA